MAEDAQSELISYGGDKAVDAPSIWLSVILLIMAAVGAWLISLMLPAAVPMIRSDSVTNWLIFGSRILRDVLRATSFLALALIVTAFLPSIGRWLERIIFHSRLAVFLTICAVLSFLMSALFVYYIYDHMPHIQDEIAMDFQAKILASGRLTAPAPKLGDFFDCEFVIQNAGRWYGKYFIGQSICLVPGEWVGMPWIVHPILGGLVVWLTYAIGASLWSDRLGRLGALLMTVSPFRMVIFGMYLGHASSLMMLGLFALAMIKLVRDPRRWGWALIGGLALGLAGNARPLTALSIGGAISLVTAVAMPWRRLTLRSTAAFALGLGFFVVVLFAYNKALTGDRHLTPFNQWSKTDRLGFGSDVGLEYWREQDKGHTLRKGLGKDVYFNMEALRANEMGWGGIVFVLMALPIFVRRYGKIAIALALPPLAVAAAHVFHVSHGVLGGQARYWSESMPMMLLLVALGLLAVRSFLPKITQMLALPHPIRGARSAWWCWCVLLILWSVPTSFATVIDLCRGEFWGLGPIVRDKAHEQHIDHALVFMQSGHYRTHFRGGIVDVYPAGFMLNDPDLKGPIVYARDLGGSRNAELIAQYPGRSLYWINPDLQEQMQFVPYQDRPTTAPSR